MNKKNIVSEDDEDGVKVDISLKKALLWKRDWGFNVKDNDWNSIKIWRSNLLLTKIDLSDFSGLTDKELIEMINRLISININNKADVVKFNNHFQTAMWVYSNSKAKVVFEKRWWITIEDIYKYFPFSNKKEIIDFLRLTEKKDWLWKISCFVSKIAYAVADILNTPNLANIVTEEEKIFKNIEWPLNIKLRSIDEWIYEWNILWKNFTLYWRPKKLWDMWEKLLWDQDYSTWESLKDGIRYTFEIDSKDDYDKYLIMQHIYNVVIGLWWDLLYYDNKWVKLTSDPTHLAKFHPEFISFLSKNNELSWKKSSSWKLYKEIKILFSLHWNKVETKITEKWNSNQNWLNFQWIYKYLDRHIWWIIIRNGWLNYITKDEIELMVVDFFDNLETLIRENPEKKWTKNSDYIKELWFDLQNNWFISDKLKYENQNKKESRLMYHVIHWLRKYYESKLIKMKLKDWTIVYTTERWEELINQWFYNNMTKFVNWKNKNL